MSVVRPIMRYHGGKFRLAKWVSSHFPPHEVYVEPYGGAASVLLQKKPARAEVINDLDQRVVGVFRVLRDPVQSVRLAEMLRFTPCSEVEYLAARERADDPVEDARRMIVLGHQSHGSTGASGGKSSGWRRGARLGGPASAGEWASLYEHVAAWADRLRGVYLECDDALAVIRRWDRPETLHYVDPPYPAQTRTTGRAYRFEMSDDDHRRLASALHACRGAVVLSGYACDLYDAELYAGWYRVERQAMADAAASRIEVLWISPIAADRLDAAAVQRQIDLHDFAGRGRALLPRAARNLGG